LKNIPKDVKPYLDCFTVIPVGHDGHQHLDALIQRLSPGLGYQDPGLSDYDIILGLKKPKAGWKIDIPWQPVMTLFLWQISHYRIREWETGSEIDLAWQLINALTKAAQRKGKPSSSPHRMTPERCLFCFLLLIYANQWLVEQNIHSLRSLHLKLSRRRPKSM
jgi:hypothetical protein